MSEKLALTSEEGDNFTEVYPNKDNLPYPYSQQRQRGKQLYIKMMKENECQLRFLKPETRSLKNFFKNVIFQKTI